MTGPRNRENRLEEARAAFANVRQHIRPEHNDLALDLVNYGLAVYAELRATEAERDRAVEALREVLEWPLPEGTVETYSLPKWLAEKARAAVEDKTP